VVCSKYPENINIKMDNTLKPGPKFLYMRSISTGDGESKGDIIQRITEAEVVCNNKNHLLCWNNLSLEIKEKLTRCCIWSAALYGSETWTIGRNEERVVNVFETWCWRGMLKTKWTDRIKNDEVFQRVKVESLHLEILKNRRHSWIGHTVGHNEFVVNILETAISGKRAVGRPRLQYLKQGDRNT